MFDENAQEKLRHYVYALFDPDRPNWPFYVGKGEGNRVFSHAAGTLLEDSSSGKPMSPKASVIADIKRRGGTVIQKIVRYGLSEETALSVEAALIDMVIHIQPETLMNQVSGHGVAEGMIDAIDLATAFAAERLETKLPVIII